MNIAFDEALTVLGGMLLALSALSGWLRAAFLSATVIAVGAGAALAGLGLVRASPGSPTILYLVELALILTLFGDGLDVEAELLRRHWRPPLRALVVAMPITLVMIAGLAHLLFPALTWAEALLLGAVLMPTDPVITSGLISSIHVPRRVRHTLNIESGLNDGLALPFVVVLAVVAAPGGTPLTDGARLVGEGLAGAAMGAALALAAGRLLSSLPKGAITPRYIGLYALGVAFSAYGVAEATIGNGLLAAFVGGIALAVQGTDLPELFRRFNENLSTGLQLMSFFTFGALLVAVGWSGGILPIVAFVAGTLLVARPAAVLLAFVGVRMSMPEKLFVAWFGPKGVASILFALFVLGSLAPDRTLVFEIASLTVLGSIVAHGLTDTVGSRWISRRMPTRGEGVPVAGDAS